MLELEGVMNALNDGLITESEARVLDVVLNGYVKYDLQPSEFKNLAKESNLPFNQLKGIVGSLVKKEFVWTEDFATMGEMKQWVHATEEGLNMVGLTSKDWH